MTPATRRARTLVVPLALTTLALLPLPGCSTTAKPEPFPGIGLEDSPNPPAIVTESEQMVLTSVDSADFESRLVGGHVPFAPRTYHQYKLPAGKHTFYTYYNNRNPIGVETHSDIRSFAATLLPNHTYTLASAPKGVAIQTSLAINPVHFNPCLIDDATNQVIASATPAK